ncbi:MAG TPA: superoxide dismutase [Candidatus Babeliales bacterium]|nr:superoxide dismutase [Candidatus Babeliales bacterium]
MAYILPPLPYEYGALEPYIDAQTMEIHHDMHHAGYIAKLEAALKDYPDLAQKPVAELLQTLPALPESIRTAVRNNGGGHYNHSFFWTLMKKNGGGNPVGTVSQKITADFGTFAAFQNTFNTAAQTVFGSGWAWLCLDKTGKLVVISTPNQDAPISQGLHPILGLDVWEHAYYLKYQNRRPSYIDAWWHVINWEQVEQNYDEIVR